MRLKVFLAALICVCAAHSPARAEQVSVQRKTFSSDGALSLSHTQRVRRVSFDCRGTWGGGSVAAQVSVNGADFTDAAQGGVAIGCSADCTRQFLAEGMGPYRAMRLSLSGSTSPDLSCVVLLGE